MNNKETIRLLKTVYIIRFLLQYPRSLTATWYRRELVNQLNMQNNETN